jgi:FkbM family methyltransferase
MNIFNNARFTERTKQRLSFFAKIEEIQLFHFLSFVEAIKAHRTIDIGANVGFYSLAVKQTFPDIQCLAFEPNPETFNELVTNFSGYQGVSIFPTAVSSFKCLLEFNDYGDCSGKNAVTKTSIHNQTGLKNTLLVSADTLDNVMDGMLDVKTVIKIDTEGHEVDAVLGSQGYISKNECVIQIESGHGNDGVLIKKTLADIGYQEILHLGPDSYYSNISVLSDHMFQKQVMERALDQLILSRWDNNFRPFTQGVNSLC